MEQLVRTAEQIPATNQFHTSKERKKGMAEAGQSKQALENSNPLAGIFSCYFSFHIQSFLEISRFSKAERPFAFIWNDLKLREECCAQSQQPQNIHCLKFYKRGFHWEPHLKKICFLSSKWYVVEFPTSCLAMAVGCVILHAFCFLNLRTTSMPLKEARVLFLSLGCRLSLLSSHDAAQPRTAGSPWGSSTLPRNPSERSLLTQYHRPKPLQHPAALLLVLRAKDQSRN